MIYLDEKLPTHPKIFRAGAKLGENGPAQALSLFIAGLGYAREHLTDGFVPDGFVRSCGLVQTPQSVAEVLASRGVRLWHRIRGGYQIHDFDQWNKKASEIKEKREKERRRKAAQRAAKNGGAGHVSRAVSRRDVPATTRARGTTIHDPLGDRGTTYNQPSAVKSQGIRTTSQYSGRASRARCANPVENANAKTADRPSRPDRDRPRGAARGPDDGRQRVAGGHQAPAARTRLDVSPPAGADRRSDGAHRPRAIPAAAAAGTVPLRVAA